MLLFYKIITSLSGPFLHLLLKWREWNGKEDSARLNERRGIASRVRPEGDLIWIHAASVGEAQSALILIEKLSLHNPDMHFLVTSGTKTSATLMANRLLHNAFHQYVPLDHPKWVERFINHWSPNLVLWMESELWPNMLLTLNNKNIPAILLNARLSDRSFKRWSYLKTSAAKILNAFNVILCQTEKDQHRFQTLGAQDVHITDNLKYSAAPLPVNDIDLNNLTKAIKSRPTWLYASTHDGEEELAARLHSELTETIPDLLTIIVPRHPERRDHIVTTLETMGLTVTSRGGDKIMPTPKTDIYVADTLGELGLFYSLSPIAMIGRSFSRDGGGGHNPIEAAQLSCAVLTGPNVQYQTQLFEDMLAHNAVKQVQNEEELLQQLKLYLEDTNALQKAIENAQKFAESKANIIDNVMSRIVQFLLLSKGKK